MVLRRYHYDVAFEYFLRANRIPHIAVDEQRRPLSPHGCLKNFDFIVYAAHRPLLIDVKGRSHHGKSTKGLKQWVSQRDVTDMLKWEALQDGQASAGFVFTYSCEHQPADALFDDVYCYQGRWYYLYACEVSDYAACMKPRSPNWQTVHLPAADFRRIAVPFRTWMCA